MRVAVKIELVKAGMSWRGTHHPACICLLDDQGDVMSSIPLSEIKEALESKTETLPPFKCGMCGNEVEYDTHISHDQIVTRTCTAQIETEFYKDGHNYRELKDCGNTEVL